MVSFVSFYANEKLLLQIDTINQDDGIIQLTGRLKSKFAIILNVTPILIENEIIIGNMQIKLSAALFGVKI